MEYSRGRQIAIYCRTLPYIVVHYRILLYIALIRNRSLFTKLVEIGRRVGGVTGVSRDTSIVLEVYFKIFYIGV